MTGEKEVLKTTCPRDCYDACGIVAIKRDGAITRVLGDPDHPVSRVRSAASARLPTTASSAIPRYGCRRRSSASAPRAKGASSRSRGTRPSGTSPHASPGSPRRRRGQDCARALHRHLLADRQQLPDALPGPPGRPRGRARHGVQHGRPRRTRLRDRHVRDRLRPAHRQRLALHASSGARTPPPPRRTSTSTGLKEAPGTVIVVDPVRHPTAEQADMHLQPFPASDASLAFAMVHVLVRDGQIDRAFLAAHALGWDELEPAIAPCTPAWARPAPACRRRRSRKRRGSTVRGPRYSGSARDCNARRWAADVMRACALLPSSHGQFRQARRGMLYLNGSGRRGVDGDYLSGAAISRSPPSFSQMELGSEARRSGGHPGLPLLEHQSGCLKPGAGAAAPRADAGKTSSPWSSTFSRPTPLTMPDYVLPAASFMEFDDLVSGYFNLSFSAQTKLQEPLGDSLPNQEIFPASHAPWVLRNPSSTRTMQRSLSGSWARWVSRAPSKSSRSPGRCFPPPNRSSSSPTSPSRPRAARSRSPRPAPGADGHPRLPLADADPKPRTGDCAC